MPISAALRDQLSKILDWNDAHVSFDAAVRDLPESVRGGQPSGLPYSPWQLLEHMRITQHDILEFCVNPSYEEISWPDDYWPKSAEPPSAGAWDASVAAYHKDREALAKLAADPKIDLTAKVPAGTTQNH